MPNLITIDIVNNIYRTTVSHREQYNTSNIKVVHITKDTIYTIKSKKIQTTTTKQKQQYTTTSNTKPNFSKSYQHHKEQLNN